ncbi:7TM diverse intracellular signaling domain-containing protein [uncultured Polaribacter sp.]|uniref:7TM diverse intracellular signaling domain-containing protein n=1 Tax=uncultured Polaribacter sp. TaxID=174711 RepID=UPI00261F3D99|nr:7TM diverse intracellular signaling domain-containing protein [uncultured Polaribacter sp.]
MSIILVLGACAENKEHTLQFSLFYFQDLAQKETIQSITTKEMRPLENPNLGYKNGVYWFKVILLEDRIPKAIVFDIPRSSIDSIGIYKDFKSLPYQELDNRFFSLLVNSTSKRNTYYIKAHFQNKVYFPLEIKAYNNAQLSEKYNFFINGVFYGLVLMVLIVNVFFYFSLKDKTFVYYCLFLLTITISITGFDGLLNALFPAFFLLYFIPVLHFLVALCGLLLANQFLNIKYYQPNGNRIGVGLLFLALCNYILFFCFYNYLFIAIANTVSLLVLLYYWVIGVFILRDHEFARFFVIGYSFVLFSAFLFVIPLDWGLQTYTISLNFIKFGALFEMLILTYAITYRIKILHKENRRFKKEINEYLDKIKILKDSTGDTFLKEQKLLKSKYNLSLKETEVLRLIYKGATNKRISEDLFISLNTVKFHIRNIYGKLDINSKIQAIDIYSEVKNAKL